MKNWPDFASPQAELNEPRNLPKFGTLYSIVCSPGRRSSRTRYHAFLAFVLHGNLPLRYALAHSAAVNIRRETHRRIGPSATACGQLAGRELSRRRLDGGHRLF